MTKLVSLSNAVYARLKQMKGKELSFSEVIMSLLEKSKGIGDLKEFAGAGKDDSEELEKFERQIDADRKRNMGRKIG